MLRPAAAAADHGPVLLLLAAIPVFLLFLGANSIWDANEAFYVETPRQMIERGDYVTPVFNGAERLNKPVLSYWIVAGFYHLFGVSVATERIAIALGALGIIAATFLIGRALHSAATGVWAGIFVATAPRFVFFSRRIFIDIYLCLFLSLALAAFALVERYPEHRRRYLLLMYVALGLGVLTKGPVALALPALACLMWLALERRLRDVRRLMILPGALIILAIVAPWVIAIYLRLGLEPIWAFIGVENLERYRTAMTGERPIWFLFSVLFGDLLMPWAPLLGGVLLSILRRERGQAPTGAASLRRLLWIWIGVIVVFFSLSASKEDLYILPVVPAAAVIIADALMRSQFGRQSPALRLVFIGIAVVCVALGIVVWTGLRAGPFAIAAAPLVGLLLVVAGAGGLAMLVVGRPATAFVVTASAFVALNYVFVAIVLPRAEATKPIPPIAQLLADRASPGSQLGAYNMMLPSLVFYANRPVRDLTEAEAASWLAGTTESWLVTGEAEWEALRVRVPSACIALRRTLFPFDRIKPSSLFRPEPPPQVLLVTNKCGGRLAGSGDRPMTRRQ